AGAALARAPAMDARLRAQLEHRARDLELHLLYVLRVAADHHRERARLDDEPHGSIPEREVARMERERDRAGLAGAQRDPPEAAKPAHGRRDRCDVVAHVELHDLVALARAGVRHVDGDDDRVTSLDGSRRQSWRAVRE